MNCPLQNSLFEVDDLTWLEPEILQLLYVDITEGLGASICMHSEFFEYLFRQSMSATECADILFDPRLKIWGDQCL
jgi:hypothetical protein